MTARSCGRGKRPALNECDDMLERREGEICG